MNLRTWNLVKWHIELWPRFKTSEIAIWRNATIIIKRSTIAGSKSSYKRIHRKSQRPNLIKRNWKAISTKDWYALAYFKWISLNLGWGSNTKRNTFKSNWRTWTRAQKINWWVFTFKRLTYVSLLRISW